MSQKYTTSRKRLLILVVSLAVSNASFLPAHSFVDNIFGAVHGFIESVWWGILVDLAVRAALLADFLDDVATLPDDEASFVGGNAYVLRGFFFIVILSRAVRPFSTTISTTSNPRISSFGPLLLHLQNFSVP